MIYFLEILIGLQIGLNFNNDNSFYGIYTLSAYGVWPGVGEGAQSAAQCRLLRAGSGHPQNGRHKWQITSQGNAAFTFLVIMKRSKSAHDPINKKVDF